MTVISLTAEQGVCLPATMYRLALGPTVWWTLGVKGPHHGHYSHQSSVKLEDKKSFFYFHIFLFFHNNIPDSARTLRQMEVIT
jgi:hypothetical protein